MHLWFAKEHILGCIHTDDKEFIKFLYPNKMDFDNGLPSSLYVL